MLDEKSRVLDCDITGPTYEAVHGGSQKGKLKLVDSNRYT